MAKRSIDIKLHNMSGFALLLIEKGLDHGKWVTDAPPLIPDNSVRQFSSESNGIMTGTQGWVKYLIQDGKRSQIYFNWDNPYASNVLGQHYNRFTERINDNYSISHTGDEHSHNMIVDLYVEVSKDINVFDFLPSKHGFKFSNHWDDFGYKIPVLHDIPILGNIKLGDASNGLCGGMVYAVRDYFEEQYPIPQTRIKANNPDDPLTKYIINRLLASLDLSDITMYLKLMNPAYADTDDGVLLQTGQQGRAYITIREEWPMIKRDIDQGHLCPIGLVRVKSLNPGDLGENHQVMVYGYRLNGTTVILKIYDPNHPENDGVNITLSLESLDKPVNAIHNVDGKPIFALFKTRYEKRSGFPRDYSAESYFDSYSNTNHFFAIKRSSTQVDLFWVGSDGKIYAAYNSLGGTWENQLYQISGNYPEPATGIKIACINRSPLQIDLFWIGTDAKIYAAYNSLGETWDNHVYQIAGDYPAPASGNSISAIQRTTEQIDIFWVGSDGKIYAAFNKLGETWENHIYQIGGGYPIPATNCSIASIQRTGTQIDLFWIGSDGLIYAAWNNLGETWENQVYHIPGKYCAPAQRSSVSCIPRSADQIDLFWIGNDGRIYAAWNKLGETWDDHVYQIPGEYPAPAPGSNISCIRRSETQIDLFWIGIDGKIYAAWNSLGETWQDHVYRIDGNYPQPAKETSITCIQRSETQIDIFWTGADGKIYAAWNNLGDTWENHIYQIPGNYSVRI